MSRLHFISSDYFSLPGLEPDSMEAAVMLVAYNKYKDQSPVSDTMGYIWMLSVLIAVCLILVMMVYGLRILFTPIRIPQKR